MTQYKALQIVQEMDRNKSISATPTLKDQTVKSVFNLSIEFWHKVEIDKI
jgi:hypothetical protein